MARGYKIQFITDERFAGTKEKLKEMIRKMKKSGVQIVHEEDMYELDWSKEMPNEKKAKQWRKNYTIGKGNMRWKEVYEKINKIYAPYYKPVKI